MYWPCGVPQVYAYHCRHHDETEHNATQDEDGIEVVNNDNVNSNDTAHQNGILDLSVVRSEQVFATITFRELTLWSTRPTTVLSSAARSAKSLEAYGTNVAIHCRPDGSNLILQTSEGYLLLYSLENDGSARVLQQQSQQSQTRKQSIARTFGSNDSTGIAEIVLRFRRAIRIDAGISAVIALDQEMIVATTKPAAVQCIKWETQKTTQQTATQLLNKMSWCTDKSNIVYMTHNRAMNLSVWLSSEGSAYAVRRLKSQANKEVSSDDSEVSSNSSMTASSRLFDGYAFFEAAESGAQARLAAVNARFSLIALALANGQILCFAAKDYAGNIPLSHRFTSTTNVATYGDVHTLSWSPDGYCLFVGYAGGWYTWSVFGKEGATSTAGNMSHAQTHSEQWLMGIRSASWISNGLEMLLTCMQDNRIWKLEFSRSAAVGCYSCANLVRALQQTPTELAIYRGHELSDLTSISNDASLWHHAQYPVAYLHNQWPVKATVVSQDGRYIAIAGKRGLAHYSVISGRWKAFADYWVENSFAVRGGFCWFGHILAVATENAQGYDLRLYSRDQELGRIPLHTEAFAMPIAFLGPSGEDSLLVYTYENILYHYIINVTERGAQLLQVGQIAFHGVVRAPSRVRSVSWVLPEDQLRNGDPSRDVEHAAVLFLIDDKVVLLQPSRTPDDAVRYDMKVIAHQVEYYILMRDQIYFNFNEPIGESAPATPSPGSIMGNIRNQMHYSLRDSLWIFTGERLSMWPEVQDLLTSVTGLSIARQPLLSVPVDFYPLSILLNKGIVLGIESELLQRRDVSFAQFRTLIRTQLFLPYVLRHQLLEANDTPIAFALAHQYQNLSYFPHALEMLLHLVLDAESDRRKSKVKESDRSEPLPATLSFLQMALSPESYLATIVQCVRKTEFSYWKYLFAHLPTPEAMFEQALALKDLKTASGYLIVLQTFDEEEEDDAKDVENRHRFEQQVVRLMTLAKADNDFELCSELARFMIGIDPAGNALRRVVQKVGFRKGSTHLEPRQSSLSRANVALNDQAAKSVKDLSKLDVRLTRLMVEEPGSAGAESEGILSRSSGGDYFSASPGEM